MSEIIINFKEFSTALNFSCSVILFKLIQFTFTNFFFPIFFFYLSFWHQYFLDSLYILSQLRFTLSPQRSTFSCTFLTNTVLLNSFLYHKRVLFLVCSEDYFPPMSQRDRIPKIWIKYSLKWNCAVPQSQFLHSCFCERFIYSQDRSTYSAAGK